MNVASKELCEELYELSGWDTGDDVWVYWKDDWDDLLEKRETRLRSSIHSDFWHQAKVIAPAYDLSYLLKNLPFFHEYWNGGNEAGYLTVKRWAVQYEAGYWEDNGDRSSDNKLTSGYADTPEDAACSLAIELFKQGILKAGEKDAA